MPATALCLAVLYPLAAFGVRSWVQYRRTGSTGFRGVSGRPGSLPWWGGVLFVLALVLGVVGPLLQFAGLVAPLVALESGVVGLVLAGAGIVATGVAQQAMGTSWRVGVDQEETTALRTGGMFGLVRNPVFTAMVVTGVGLAALAPNPCALAGVAALCVAVAIQVRVVEEPYLLRTHGEAYRAYASRVGRFIPLVGRLTYSTS